MVRRKSARICSRCEARRCNKFYRVPCGNPTRRIFIICGKCIVNEAQATREWLNEQESKFK